MQRDQTSGETRGDESKERQEERGGQQWHRDLRAGESFRITTPWGDAALIFPRIFNRDLLLSPSVRVTASSFHRFYLPRYLLAQLPSRWCFYLSFSLSLELELDSSRGDRGVAIPSRQFVRRWIVKTARKEGEEGRRARDHGSRALNPISLCREVVGELLLHGRRAIAVLFPPR